MLRQVFLAIFCTMLFSGHLRGETLQESLQKHLAFKPDGANTIGHITIDDREGGINQSTWLYVKTALAHYKTEKPLFVILELNTPGGEVFAAQQISDALKELGTQYNIPVVAFINNWAISAGAMLAYSSRYIAVVKDASMGAAEPVMMQGQEMKEASEKVNSALRADFANRASFFDRNPYIAEGMVDKDTILVLREGKIMKLDNEDQIQQTDFLVKAKGKLLTLTTDQLIRYGVADIYLPPIKLEPITELEKEAGKWSASKMALFHQDFFKDIPNAVIDTYKMDWKTKFFVFLSSPLVSSALVMGLIIGAYLEINGSGFGIAGTVAATCLFLIILSSYSLQVVSFLEIIFLLTGIAIIAVELFILPTFGLLGFIGILLFLAGLIAIVIPGIGSVSYEFDTQSFNAAGVYFFERLSYLMMTLISSAIVIALLGRYLLPKFAAFNRFVLIGNEQLASEGYSAGAEISSLPKTGTLGSALTPLRPSGKIIIEGKMYDVVSDGGFIEKDSPVEVLRLEGNRIVVREKANG